MRCEVIAVGTELLLGIIVDSNSIAYLQGVVLDWGNGLLGTGFKFSNPNAASTCGCGKSFSV